MRVTFFQSNKPQQISPPADFEFHCFSNPLLDNLFISPADIGNNNMTAALMPDYKRNLRYGEMCCCYSINGSLRSIWYVAIRQLNFNYKYHFLSSSYHLPSAVVSASTLNVWIISCNSIDDGSENPFRPDGELSKEADEIVNLIKGN